jgi:hypothetical protein
MKRDLDLIRSILLAVEEEDNIADFKPVHIEGYEDELVWHHLQLLDEAGLIEGQWRPAHGVRAHEWLVRRLTWEGHEFLADARNETVWATMKQRVAEKGGSVSLGVASALLAEIAKKALGIP